MSSKRAGSKGQIDLFGARLEGLLDSTHPLYVLAQRIDWHRFEAKFGICFADSSGRPALSTRLVVGLEYLKYTFNESDESVVEKFVENHLLALLLRPQSLHLQASLSPNLTRQVAGEGWS